MGKHGPCYHCGVTSTPLWRNGPPEKPVLCNACGSRWRTKGSLVNYTPLHSRTEPDDVEDYRVSKGKTAHIKKKETKVLKRKFDNNIAQHGGVPYPDYNKEFCKVFDEDTSNRSSSGSGISNSERCAQYGSVDVISDLTGQTQHIVCDTIAPSKKRSLVTRSQPSSVEKLTKDLYTIWQEQQSSCLSGCSEEKLLFETDKPIVSVEFGNGGLLIRHPSSMAREEESEASSLSIDHKQYIVNSQPMAFAGQMDDMNGNFSSRGIDKVKIPTNPEQDQILRHNDQLEKMQILTRHDSPLCHVDMLL